MRGFFSVGLVNPKTPENVGSALRASAVYGAASVHVGSSIRTSKALRHCTDTTKAWRHMPVFIVADVLNYRAFDCQAVAVDLVPDAVSLAEFKHPDRAIYVFGPEDGTLGKSITDRCQHKVYIPTRHCMNLAATVNVVLYDRAVKRNEWPVKETKALPRYLNKGVAA